MRGPLADDGANACDDALTLYDPSPESTLLRLRIKADMVPKRMSGT